MKKLLFTASALLLSIGCFAQTKIEAKDAAKHLNEKVSICDKVFGGKFFTSSSLTLLDVGGNHPNEFLTLVIKAEDRKKFTTAPEDFYKGKNVCVTGKVIDFKGKPEVIITDPEQLKVQ
jgi:hypothetical protein